MRAPLIDRRVRPRPHHEREIAPGAARPDPSIIGLTWTLPTPAVKSPPAAGASIWASASVMFACVRESNAQSMQSLCVARQQIRPLTTVCVVRSYIACGVVELVLAGSYIGYATRVSLEACVLTVSALCNYIFEGEHLITAYRVSQSTARDVKDNYY